VISDLDEKVLLLHRRGTPVHVESGLRFMMHPGHLQDNSNDANNSKDEGKTMDTSNRWVTIHSKNASNSKEDNNEDVENIFSKIVVRLGRSR
jgi:hypothetical protein